MCKILTKSIQFICLAMLVISSGQKAEAQNKEKNQGRITTNFDRDWTFIQKDIPGAENPMFNDQEWRKLQVPHDWSIEGAYDKTHLTGRGGGYLPSGIGWYRKRFELEEKMAGYQISIEFDGVMANSEVWINGHSLGKRPYGYIGFGYNLTKYLHFGKGKLNVIAVRADNLVQPASRFYTGAGIYRHVRLLATQLLHIDKWGVYITTPEVGADKATVRVQTKLNNVSGKSEAVTIETMLLNPAGRELNTVRSKRILNAGESMVLEQKMIVAKPALWNLEKPQLYKANSKISMGTKVVDQQTNTFGIRSARFDAATGFWLNDKNFKIKGVCLHHDGGAVGAAVPLSVWRYRFNLLKEAGVNAIRTAHNPAAPEFLDLCDEMGFLVMDETFDTWTVPKNNGEQGYNRFWKEWWERDTRDMVLRDRNHPSVIIYSVGNEIHDNLDSPEGFKKYRDQQDLIHQLDSGRPVTMALFRPASSKVYTNGFAETMDVVGQNYRENELVAIHQEKPQLKVLGTENTHVLQQYLALRDHPFMAGQFLWTGFAYLGEADWPQTTWGESLFDRIGNWTHLGLQRQSWWSASPVVHIVRKEGNAGAGEWINNWTPTDFDTYDDGRIAVFSNCDEVDLVLNGKSLGVKPKPADDSPRMWNVTFEKGTLTAVGMNKGKVVIQEELKTASRPAKIVLSSDRTQLRSEWDEAVFVKAVVLDANGVVCPNADQLITFHISGGEIAGVDNGNVNSHELYKANQRQAYHGVCMAMVKGNKPGHIELKATAEGLEGGVLNIEVIK